MNILLTNDDGYFSPGIQVLYEALDPDHEVMLVAPDREQSAVSHSITFNRPTRMRALDLPGRGQGYAVDGTPADCVKLALHDCCKTIPDMVISGINPGMNVGIDLYYSGTVAAAREAALNGMMALAVSIRYGQQMDFAGLARFVARLIPRVQTVGLPRHTLLNLNAPDGSLDPMPEVRMTRQGFANLTLQFDRRTDPRNKPYFWYERMNEAPDATDTDIGALAGGCVSITPIHCDQTDYSVLPELSVLTSG